MEKIMENYIINMHTNYNSATRSDRFDLYWHVFENYFDRHFPHSGKSDPFRKRVNRFEKHLKQILIHETFWHRLYHLPEAKELAELEPRIFRETTGDTSPHEAFASDYSRFVRGQKPKEPLARLINLLYTVRCNVLHGQKILPISEWEDIRKRNEKVFSLTTPLLVHLDNLVLTQFVARGVFSYGTLQEASESDFPFQIERYHGLRIKGRLYDMGQFPAWRYNTREWVKGTVLRAPASFRLKYISLCDEIEGKQFERRLELAYDQNGNAQHIVWAYHYVSEPDHKTRIKDGIWRGSHGINAGNT
jgi:gamma-glutamylcyclotransferase (GGCT)/AIG2-like uncharacterized protein YtfP